MDDFFNLSENAIPCIGQQAPAFRSVTTQGSIYFPTDYVGKWAILFSYPADITPLITSEFERIAIMHDDFKSFNCELIGFSVGGPCNHIARLHSIKEKIEYKGMKDIEIRFPRLLLRTAGKCCRES